MQRRKFITNTIRGSLLGGLALLSGKLLLTKKTENCEYIYLCNGCNKLTDCKLDKAKEFRRNLENSHH